ncbi:CDP-alcohol phosphatidyltransferase family protein [Streptomyces sp. YIM 98790]|uniref:CDP-alcohol phosphatidyltransferase family protein n=1 Tax=Streptomyces sp. YIM 98790 TaxID=2689077 RepID=UPI0028BEB77C|nr:CDP-alcohol phosphatidyltransferase family protein [Streptomyces sp. YIM 98790]
MTADAGRAGLSAAAVALLPGSRAATDALLAGLRADGWGSPSAWLRFVGRASRRSVVQAALRPGALLEVTVLHGAALAATRGRGRYWVAGSWLLAATHLGLLQERSHLSLADVLTLARANLPALPAGRSRWAGALAIGLDLADGRLARHRRTVTPFGAYADHLADAAFWTHLALRREPDRRLRTAALVAWAAPVAAVTAVSVARGRMAQAPRPVLLRPAAAMQAVLAARQLAGVSRPGRAGGRGRGW